MSKLPGFTADLTVYTSDRIYQRSNGNEPVTNAALPQFWRPWGSEVGGCNPNCVCLWPNGCPCCIGPGPGGYFSK